MIALRLPFVVPTSFEWLGLFAVIGIFSFAAQILLTMGFQRETAGRASMALYTQVHCSKNIVNIVKQRSPTSFFL